MTEPRASATPWFVSLVTGSLLVGDLCAQESRDPPSVRVTVVDDVSDEPIPGIKNYEAWNRSEIEVRPYVLGRETEATVTGIGVTER